MLRSESEAYPVSQEQVRAIQKGIAYRAMAESDGYRFLLDYMEAQSNLALQELRDAKLAEDAVKLYRLRVWQERERMLEEAQIEVQRGIERGKEAARELRSVPGVDLPIDFGEDE